MTGFNHYADCGCGWCVNDGYRLSSSKRNRLLTDLHRRDSLNVLKSNLARSISGCYVNPNAKCPVCRDPVYFYSNQHGSRVFFDDLGPPWPKHGCTDNPREYVPSQGAPTRRARGLMQELVSAANVADLFKNKVFGHRIREDWTLLLVVSVERRGDENSVTAEFLDSLSCETTKFTCRSDEPVLEPDDFINMKGKEISFIHKATLIPVTFVDGAVISIPDITTLPPPVPPRDPAVDSVPSRKVVHSKLKRAADYSRAPMTEAEMIHFNSDSVDLGQLFAKLEPVVKAYARDQTRKPVDVSLRLNAEGYTTAVGAGWTPRLVHFLLALMFNNQKPDQKPGSTGEVRPLKSKTAVPKVAISMNDKDQLARLLSSLGRVTLRH